MVRTPSARLARALLLPLMLTVVPSNAFAALGGSVTSVDADRVHVQGALMRIVRNDAYALHEIRSASGTMIREYVNGSGTVFAVAWDGRGFRICARCSAITSIAIRRRCGHGSAHKRGAASVVINDGGLVVQMSGHPRAFTGRAYVPALMPAGVQPESIR